jgi:lipopolysaccharide transport system permease protein
MISIGMFREVWYFRSFVIESVKREFISRYTGTQLGSLWAIIQPLAMILIYTLVFANVMKPSLPGYKSRFAYSIYLCAGVLPWGFFSEILTRSVGVFIQNANLLKKVSFPKLTLPLVVIFSTLTHFTIVMVLYLGFLFLTGNLPGWPVLAAIPVLIILIGFAVGLGILCGTINVFYRDVQQAIGIVLQFWFWLTPIVYVSKILPAFVTTILQWNPMWPVINAMQTIFLEGCLPDWKSLIYPSLLAVAFLFLGMFAFWKLQGEIVDEL